MENQTPTQTPTPKSDWAEIKSKLQQKFGKLPDEAIESAKDNLDLLSAKLRHFYGYAREQADREIKNFKESIKVAVAPEPVVVSPPPSPAPAPVVAPTTPVSTKVA